MIKRVINFDKQDWKHIWFLFTGMLKSFFIDFDWHETKECFIFMKIHLTHDSKRVN